MQLVDPSSSKDSLSFSIWDFGGQAVFYTLHHLFLTEYGCYVLVFDLTKLLREESRKDTIEYLRFWLFSKKLHAPNASVFIVGTRCNECRSFEEEMKIVNKILKNKVLKTEEFNVEWNHVHKRLCFFPVDNEDSTNIDGLRQRIEVVVRGSDYIEEEVPLSFLRVLELCLETKQNFLHLG